MSIFALEAHASSGDNANLVFLQINNIGISTVYFSRANLNQFSISMEHFLQQFQSRPHAGEKNAYSVSEMSSLIDAELKNRLEKLG